MWLMIVIVFSLNSSVPTLWVTASTPNQETCEFFRKAEVQNREKEGTVVVSNCLNIPNR